MNKSNQYKITLEPSGVEFFTTPNKSLLDSAIRHNINLEYSCKNGKCSACEVDILNGEDAKTVLSCQYFPDRDTTIKADFFSELSNITCITSPAKVNAISFLSSNNIVIKLRLPPKNKFDFLPGQYLNITYQGTTRSYSIASTPTSELIELHIKRVELGEMSEKLFFPISNNQLLQIEGPKGTFFFRDKKEGPIIFLATGTGFAPIKSMVSAFLNKGDIQRQIFIYWGNRFVIDFYDEAPIQWNAQNSNIHYTACLSRNDKDWKGRVGYVQDCIVSDRLDLQNAEVYACGSIDMIHSAKRSLVLSGLNEEDFYSDAFVAS